MSWTITQIASVVLSAMCMGLLFSCFGHPPVLGYIVAGLILGPSCLSLIADYESVTLFSEMGIIFLLFIIGLGLSFEKIKNIWKSSVLLTLSSTAATYAALSIIGHLFKIPCQQIILFAFCITLSSTAITVKSLDMINDKSDTIRESTFGILIAQDLISLAMVLVINFMSHSGNLSVAYKSPKLIALILFAVGTISYFAYFHKYVYKVTNFIKKHSSMQSIIMFSLCLGGAVFAELAGFSAPFGAFISGLILGNSNLKEEAKNVSEPIEELLLMTFFLSVGLLVDLKFIWENLGFIFLALLYVAIGKTALNVGLLRLFKFSMKDSFIISVLLGHIGEFSFMLAFAASKVGIIGITQLKFLVSLTALSLFLSPFWLIFAERCRQLASSTIELSPWDFFQLVVSREKRKMDSLIRISDKYFKISLSALKKCCKFIADNLQDKTKQ